jgi:uncharacterized membrane protein YciS (DUF1049 family)
MNIIIQITLYTTLLAIAFFLGSLISLLIFGKPKLMNKLVSKYQQSKQIMRNIQKNHSLINSKCGKIECLNS